MKQELLHRELIARQGADSDYTYAALLGIPVSTWRHYRTGRRRLGRRLAQAVSHLYPRLRDLVRDALLESDGTPNDHAA